jgi:hypothetical protein
LGNEEDRRYEKKLRDMKEENKNQMCEKGHLRTAQTRKKLENYKFQT